MKRRMLVKVLRVAIFFLSQITHMAASAMEAPEYWPIEQDKRARAVNTGVTSEQSGKKITLLQREPAVYGYKIFLDAGHGGKDKGALGLAGTLEKQITLKLSKMIRRELEKYQKFNDFPLTVEMSREEDEFVLLRERTKRANEWGGNVFVSIHCNSSPFAKAHGYEVYFLSTEASDPEVEKLARMENGIIEKFVNSDVLTILNDAQKNSHIAESSELAETVFSAMSRRIVATGRGIKQGPFTVLHGTAMPSVLIEIGYLTNYKEASLLTKESYLKKLAGAITSGIVEYVEKKSTKKRKLGLVNAF